MDLGRAVPRVCRRKESKQHEAMRSKTKQTNNSSQPASRSVKGNFSNRLSLLEFSLSLYDGINEPQKSCEYCSTAVFMFADGQARVKEIGTF